MDQEGSIILSTGIIIKKTKQKTSLVLCGLVPSTVTSSVALTLDCWLASYETPEVKAGWHHMRQVSTELQYYFKLGNQARGVAHDPASV